MPIFILQHGKQYKILSGIKYYMEDLHASATVMSDCDEAVVRKYHLGVFNKNIYFWYS